jgi:hypothetical protein
MTITIRLPEKLEADLRARLDLRGGGTTSSGTASSRSRSRRIPI